MTEGTTDETKGIEQTQEGEAKSTQEQKQPTAGRTYTEADFQKAVSKGLESTTRQLSLQQAEAKAAKAEAEQYKSNIEAIEAEMQELQRQHDDLVSKQFADDPEARQAYIDRRAIADERRKLAKEKAEVEKKLYEGEKKAWAGAMALKSIELKSRYQVPQEVLDTCITEEQMEIVAKAFPEVKEVKPVETPKFDSGVGGGGGTKSEEERLRERYPAMFSKK